MQITSPAFENGNPIPRKYTCDGDNVNPPLLIEEIPEGTKSLVLIMEDRDVPKDIREDGLWHHWIIFNMPPETKEIAENHKPFGIAGKGTDGKLKYQGPCPPDKEHRYFFKLYALSTLLDLPEGSNRQTIERAMHDHILEETQLMGTYAR